jgi:hypothetical protein
MNRNEKGGDPPCPTDCLLLRNGWQRLEDAVADGEPGVVYAKTL